MKKFLLLVVIIAGSISIAVCARYVSYAETNGRVVDANGQAVEGARVWINYECKQINLVDSPNDISLNNNTAVVTDSNGEFHFPSYKKIVLKPLIYSCDTKGVVVDVLDEECEEDTSACLVETRRVNFTDNRTTNNPSQKGYRPFTEEDNGKFYDFYEQKAYKYIPAKEREVEFVLDAEVEKLDQYGNRIPVIASVTPSRGSVGTTIQINGTDFPGFESDVIFWIENQRGEKGTLFVSHTGIDPTLASKVVTKIPDRVCMQVTVYSGNPCTSYMNLTPGTYKIYTSPWGTDSNKLSFEVLQNSASQNSSRQLLMHAFYSDYDSPNVAKIKNLSIEPSNTSALYKSGKFEIMLPYNEVWGNGDYKLPPFELINDYRGETLVFGPIARYEGGGLTRSGAISIVSKESKNTLMSKYSKPNSDTAVTFSGTINGRDVVIVGEGSFGTHYIYIVGEKQNLMIHVIPFNTQFDQQEFLLSMIRTLKLFDI